MANLPRYAIINHGSTFHVTWQCHNKDWLLESNWAKQIYYNLLLKYKDRYQVKIYSYCFMSSHPHMTGYCEDRELFSDFFRVVNSCFAKTYNKNVGRRGQVVMDRFKSPRIESDGVLLKVMFYNDLNPNRAKMVKHPREYEWTSYHYYAEGKADALITPAPSYMSLGLTAQARQQQYKKMVELILRHDWQQKQPYSSVAFIGNPEWVQKKTQVLLQKQKEQFRKWLNRHREKFG